MGTVKRDIYKHGHRNDTTYPYTDAGIERLLADIYKLPHEESYGGNYDTVVLRVDLERALQSQALSPRQRVAIGLYYFAQLTQEECARVLGLTKQAIDDRLATAMGNLSEQMDGYNINNYICIQTDDGVYDENSDDEYPHHSLDRRRPQWEVLMEEPYNKQCAVTRNQRRFGETGYNDAATDELTYQHRKFSVNLPSDNNIRKTGRFWTYDM
jgi:predicted DNA-binding protein (UPF0251 family)